MKSKAAADRPVDRRVAISIVVLLAVYGIAIATGRLPSQNHGGHDVATDKAVDDMDRQREPSAANDGQRPENNAEVAHLWAVAPFVALLGAIAVLPLAGPVAHWWEHHRHKLLVSLLLGATTLVYLGIAHPQASWRRAADTLHHTLLFDYLPFIVLLFSLYTISGGISIAGDLPARPLTNALFLAAGGLLASMIGTTGAAMLLIRPLLETNRERKHVKHTVVFFILVVCNCGGLLLPLGDPPLFLGYLNGVPFFWTLSLWRSWLLVNGLLIAAYCFWDRLWWLPRESSGDRARDEARVHRLRIAGATPNVWLLVGVVASVALLDPSRPIPGFAWQPWLYLREAAQLALVAVSIWLTPSTIRSHHGFNYGAIIEVACLFVGIFVTMQPALEILAVRGKTLGLSSAASFYWASGALSSVLDNAPTYLVFFKAAQSLSLQDGVISGVHHGVAAGVSAQTATVAGVALPLLQAFSMGAVFMGAMTYIGNGPNFMVKTIAESSGVKMPSFFGYIAYSAVILLPILALNAWLFL